MKIDGDITKLPKWAQSRIQRLERDIAFYQERLAEGPENSDTFAEPYATPPRPLGRETTVELRLGDNGEAIHVRTERDTRGRRSVYVYGSNMHLSVQPLSSNTLRIVASER